MMNTDFEDVVSVAQHNGRGRVNAELECSDLRAKVGGLLKEIEGLHSAGDKWRKVREAALLENKRLVKVISQLQPYLSELAKVCAAEPTFVALAAEVEAICNNLQPAEQ